MTIPHSQKHNVLDFSQPLQIAVFGLDDQTRRTLEKALRNSGKHCATLVGKSTAEAGIFDFDNSETSLCWASYRKTCPDLPTIVFGSTDPQLSDALYISKPIRISKLKEAIDTIKQTQPNHVKNSARIQATENKL